MSTAYVTVVEAEVPVVSRALQLRQAYNTTQTIRNDTIILFELDAIAGPIKDIKVEFWLFADGVVVNITPGLYKTREGALVTFTLETVPGITALAQPGLATASRYLYKCGDLSQGAQLQFRVAQTDNGAANIPIDGVLTYLLAS